MTFGEDGILWVAGSTTSLDYPTTPGVYGGESDLGRDIFVTAMTADLRNVLVSTMFGDVANDVPRSIDLAVDGRVMVGGFTNSPSFPTTKNAISMAPAGETDGFILILSDSLETLTYSTLVGGRSFDVVRSAMFAKDGAILAIGYTNSTDFPTTPDAYMPSKDVDDHDAFFMELPPDGSGMNYSKLLGADMGDFGMDMALDGSGVPIMAGHTRSSRFPTAGDPADPGYNGGGDALVLRLSTDTEPPVVLADMSDYEPRTGQPFTFRADVSDATGVNLVLVRFWYDGADPVLSEMESEGVYSLTTTIAPSARDLHYQFAVFDVLGNENETAVRTVPILDVIPPEIVQVLTLGKASTGDRLSLAAVIDDNIDLRAAYVEYETSDGGANTTMISQADPWPEGAMAYNITVPRDSVDPVRYRFSVVDHEGNWNRTDWYEVTVIDNIPPVLGKMDLPESILSGTALTINVSASDNIAITYAFLTWGPRQGNQTFYPAPPYEPFIEIEVTIGRNWSLEEYTFSLVAMDGEGLATYSQATVQVTDSDPPRIYDVVHPETVRTGGMVEIGFKVGHVIPLERTWMHYWFGAAQPTEWTPPDLDHGSVTIPIPTNSTEPLVFEIWTRDVRGNVDFSWEVTVEVRDEEPPTADAGPDITVGRGEELILVAEGSGDNVGIANYTWRIQISEWEVVRELYGLTVTTSLPDAGVYDVTLVVTDWQGNEDSDTLKITVKADGAEAGLTAWEVTWVVIPPAVAALAVAVWYTRKRAH